MCILGCENLTCFAGFEMIKGPSKGQKTKSKIERTTCVCQKLRGKSSF